MRYKQFKLVQGAAYSELTTLQQDYYVMLVRIRKLLEYGLGYSVNLKTRLRINSKTGKGHGLVQLHEMTFPNGFMITYGLNKSGSYYFELDFSCYKLVVAKLFHGKPELVASRDLMFRINHTIFFNTLVDKTNDIDELELESLLHEFYNDYMGEDAYGELIRDSILADSLTPAELQHMTPW